LPKISNFGLIVDAIDFWQKIADFSIPLKSMFFEHYIWYGIIQLFEKSTKGVYEYIFTTKCFFLTKKVPKCT
jgi:hypothetical protein